MSPIRPLLVGALAVGVLDGIDALLFFGARGVPRLVVLQSIASGLLGRAAYRGGIATAVLGTALHFGIALAVVTTYYLASGRIPSLVRRPWVYGPLYGLVVYCVMTFVVVPLSAAVVGRPSPAVIVNGVLIHMLGVGIPSALAARAASRGR